MFILQDIFRLFSRYRLKLIVLLAAGVWGAVWVWPDSKLTFVFCSVGQGDASIVSRGLTQVLIDAGPVSSKAADCLDRHLPFFDRRLEAVIVSHAQADHFGGMAEVLSRYRVDKFIFNGIGGESKSWAEVSRLVEAEKSQVIVLAQGDKLKIDEIKIDVLWPTDKNYKNYKSYNRSGENGDKILGVASSRNLNADGLVLRLSYGDFSALFTGDIGTKEESVISSRLSVVGSRPAGRQPIDPQQNRLTDKPINNKQKTDNRKPITVLKVAHHGSKTSSSSEFLSAVMPKLAVVEVGKNSYGHPADEVIERLEEVGAKVLRTDLVGDVVIETNGKEWRVSSGF